MNGGGEKLGASGLGLRQLGFQGVAQRQQLGHLRHDPLLLGQRWDGGWTIPQLSHVDRREVRCLLCRVLKERPTDR